MVVMVMRDGLGFRAEERPAGTGLKRRQGTHDNIDLRQVLDGSRGS